MATRKTALEDGEYYHIYNRGTEKRDIVLDDEDIERFLASLVIFNTDDATGGVHTSKYNKKIPKENEKSAALVEIIAYNILDNHYHLLLRQIAENGISRFMQRVGGGYTKYFNEKYERSGVLFQGAFKSAHIKTDSQLVKLSAYINLNNEIHKLRTPTSKWGKRSSFSQYIHKKDDSAVLVQTDIILDRYQSPKAYMKEAQKIVTDIRAERDEIENDVLIDQLRSRSSK